MSRLEQLHAQHEHEHLHATHSGLSVGVDRAHARTLHESPHRHRHRYPNNPMQMHQQPVAVDPLVAAAHTAHPPPAHLPLHSRTHTAPALPPLQLQHLNEQMQLQMQQQLQQQMQTQAQEQQQEQSQTVSPLAISTELIQRRLQENEWKRRTIAAHRMQSQSAAGLAAHSRTRSLQQGDTRGEPHAVSVYDQSAGAGAGPVLEFTGGGERELQILTDEYIALLLQNEEFVNELRRDPEFMQTLELGVLSLLSSAFLFRHESLIGRMQTISIKSK